MSEASRLLSLTQPFLTVSISYKGFKVNSKRNSEAVKQNEINETSLSRLTDFAICDSLTEVEDFKKESDLSGTSFDLREIYDYSLKRHRVLVYACPRCRGGAENVF